MAWHPEILLSLLLSVKHFAAVGEQEKGSGGSELLCLAGLSWAQHLVSAHRSWFPGLCPCYRAPLRASLGTVLDQEWKPLAFLSHNVPPWHVSAPAGPTAPQGPSRAAGTQTKERCWGGQHRSMSGMAEPGRHRAD